MQKIFRSSLFALIILFAFNSNAQSLGSDPRIRTIIYGSNDVFRVNAVFGYQTVVEFQNDERIQTISIGNPNIFKIIPSKNRLFVKAYQNGQLTNMTLITNKRMYQFELTSNADNVDDMMYLVRFVYPGEEDGSTASNQSAPMNIYSPISLPAGTSSSSSMNMSMPSTSGMIDLPSTSSIDSSDVPLSIQFRNPGQRKGLNQSPIQIGPTGMINITSTTNA